MRLSIHLQLLGAFCLFACAGEENGNPNSSSGGDGTAASAADWSGLCVSRCGWDQRCATATNPVSATCQVDCESDTTKPEVFRRGAVAVMKSCFETLDCASSDDKCSAQAILAVVADPTADSKYQSCRARYESCASSDPGSFSDDICTQRLLLTDATQPALDACLAGACAQVADCIDAVLGT